MVAAVISHSLQSSAKHIDLLKKGTLVVVVSKKHGFSSQSKGTSVCKALVISCQGS